MTMPNSCSMLRMAPDKAGCETLQAAAARPKCCSRASATTKFNCLMNMACVPGYRTSDRAKPSPPLLPAVCNAVEDGPGLEDSAPSSGVGFSLPGRSMASRGSWSCFMSPCPLLDGFLYPGPWARLRARRCRHILQNIACCKRSLREPAAKSTCRASPWQQKSRHGPRYAARRAPLRASSAENMRQQKRLPVGSLVRAPGNYSGVFLPPLNEYSVKGGFFISPLGSKTIVVVTPLKLDLANSFR